MPFFFVPSHAFLSPMKPIRMVDLVTQYEKIKPEVDAAVLDVMNRAAFIKGPEVTRFEENLSKYLHCRHVIGCANGTDALQIAMMALDLKPGDEVEIDVAGPRRFVVSRGGETHRVLARLRRFRGRMPKGFRFHRLEAHARR